MADYRIIYQHLVTEEMLGELPVQTFDVEWALNSPGAMTATLPLKLAESTDKLTGQVATPELTLEEYAIALYVERDGVIIWAGVLQGVEANVDADTLTISGQGFQSRLRSRLIRENITYNDTEQFLIFKDLIDRAQSKPGGDLHIDTSGLAFNPSGVLRDRTYYGFERATYADRIEQLAAVSDGFDFRFPARWGEGGIERYVEASYPPEGRLTNHVLALGTNVSLLSYRSDLTVMANWVDAVGTGDGETKLIAGMVDSGRFDDWGLLEIVEPRTSVLDFTTLQGHARRRVIEGRFPNRQLDLEVYPDAVPVFGSYLEGDVVWVSGRHGYLNIGDFYRITTRRVSVGDDGTETVQLTATTWRLYTDG